MPGLVPGIHVLELPGKKDVDGRDEPGHDEKRNLFHVTKQFSTSFRGDAKHRTRNLEIPGLVLAHHPGMTGSYGLLRCARNDGCGVARYLRPLHPQR